MLDLTGVRSGYGPTDVLHGVDLQVPDGAAVVVLGRNGVGKTTLLKTIAGLLRLKAGAIALDGADITGLTAHARTRRGVGYVPQGREVFAGLSVLENVIAAAPAASFNKAKKMALDALAEFPALRPKLDDRAGSLSGGQQQMLALVRALVREPSLLLLDEPAEGIQPSIVDELGEKLRQLTVERRLSILLVEQNLQFATSVTDQMLIMVKGQIVRRATASELLSSPEMQHEFLGV